MSRIMREIWLFCDASSIHSQSPREYIFGQPGLDMLTEVVFTSVPKTCILSQPIKIN